MKPKKPCANCGVVPEVNIFLDCAWIQCRHDGCEQPMKQRRDFKTPEQAIAVWDAPRWYEVPPIDDVPPLDNQRREVVA